MTKIEKAMNDAHPLKQDYVWKQNGLYMNRCAKPKCNNAVVMKRSVADGYHVVVCNLCGTKQIEKDSEREEL